jgi:hypothetical protein
MPAISAFTAQALIPPKTSANGTIAIDPRGKLPKAHLKLPKDFHLEVTS